MAYFFYGIVAVYAYDLIRRLYLILRDSYFLCDHCGKYSYFPLKRTVVWARYHRNGICNKGALYE